MSLRSSIFMAIHWQIHCVRHPHDALPVGSSSSSKMTPSHLNPLPPATPPRMTSCQCHQPVPLTVSSSYGGVRNGKAISAEISGKRVHRGFAEVSCGASLRRLRISSGQQHVRTPTQQQRRSDEGGGKGEGLDARLSPWRTDYVSPKREIASTARALSPPAEDAPADVAAGGEGIKESFWTWRGHSIRYQAAGDSGPPILLVHGFGANCDHWRKNIPVLAKDHRVFAVDLLGYGYSSKPQPAKDARQTDTSPYTFETWAAQLLEFADEFVGGPVFIACNSVGGIAGLQAAVTQPDRVSGVLLLNPSLRMLHVKKQTALSRPFVSALQWVLRNTDAGRLFFQSVATSRSVANILRQCYANPEAVTDELVECILRPGLEPGAVDVFLDFICYSGGPLPEELIPQAQCPVAIGWGAEDPWEPVAMGRAFASFPTVTQFVEFEGVGHCPQDEAPNVVNPFIASFVASHASRQT